tara:strand:+ start:37 stop:612 length:576 start_codon:yes stop_codon:yes gene_type:complete
MWWNPNKATKEELDFIHQMKIDGFGVIDNFLPQKEFEELQTTLMKPNPESNENIEWIYASTIGYENEPKNWKYFYMVSKIYDQGIIISPYIFKKIIPVLEHLNVKAIVRIKANLYPNSEKVHEHEKHTDYDFSHKTALFSLNTCNGYTKLKDGTKIDSVANRVLLFDASKLHLSTTTSDTTARFNINFNYF